MKCLPFDSQNDNDEELKNHYNHFHLVNEDNYLFKELFTTDTENRYSRRCDDCKIRFQSSRQKKKEKKSFSVHHKQVRGVNNHLPINASKTFQVPLPIIRSIFLYTRTFMIFIMRKK